MSHQGRIAAIHRSPLKTATLTNLVTSITAAAPTPHFDETLPTTTIASISGRTTAEEEFQFPRLASPSTEDGREAVVASMTVMRVLNVARHWITKYPEVSRQIFDFLGSVLLK